ncbi:MAG: aspartate kinase, partial [Sphingobacteriales bacterium]
MKVYKFGGASVKDAAAVRNVAAILQDFEENPLLVVISAMGKTTNALENVLNLAWKDENFDTALQESKDYHTNILADLLPNKNLAIWKEIDKIFDDIAYKLVSSKKDSYDFLYDQVVGYGEILSTKIVSAYLSIFGYAHIWY